MNIITIIKLTTIFSIAAFLTIKANAQIYVGGKMGFHISTLSFGDKEYWDPYKIGIVPGYDLGAAMNLKITKSFDLYGELIYSIKGANIKTTDNLQVNDRIFLNYFDVPFMLRIKLHKSPESNLFFQMGPTIGYWYKGGGKISSDELNEQGYDKLKYGFRWEETSHISEGVFVSDPNRIQLSLNIGIGNQILLRNKHIVIIDLRYEIGNTYLGTSENKQSYITGYASDFKANNKVLKISTAYLFNGQAIKRKLR